MSLPQRQWPVGLRILFRFAFSYWALYVLPVFGSASPLDILPWGSERLEGVLFWPMQHLSLWTGVHLFHLHGIAGTWHPTGSGDTALTWVLTLCLLVIAAVATVVWSVLDRKRTHYGTLAAWLRLLLAFTLGLAMLEYGFAKVVPLQFGPLSLDALTEAYGDSTPMRLLWTFMGASTGYTFLAGLGECVGGLMLLFRRTRTAGALLSGAIVFNIFLLNMFYDVPVKLYSFHLLLMAGLVLLPDLRALFGLLFLREQVQLRTDGVPAPQRRGIRITAWVLQIAILLGAGWRLGYGTWKSRYVPPERPLLFGTWRVDRAASSAPQVAWLALRFYTERGVVVRLADGHEEQLRFATGSNEHLFRFTNTKLGGGELRATMEAVPKPRTMVLDGRVGAPTVHIELTRISPDSFELETHGFHWVHDDVPNR